MSITTIDREDLDRTTTLACLTDGCEETFSAHTVGNARILRDYHHLREHDGGDHAD